MGEITEKQRRLANRLAEDAKRLKKGEATSNIGKGLPLEALRKGLVSASTALAAAAGDPDARKRVGTQLRTPRLQRKLKDARKN